MTVVLAYHHSFCKRGINEGPVMFAAGWMSTKTCAKFGRSSIAKIACGRHSIGGHLLTMTKGDSRAEHAILRKWKHQSDACPAHVVKLQWLTGCACERRRRINCTVIFCEPHSRLRSATCCVPSPRLSIELFEEQKVDCPSSRLTTMCFF